MMICTKCGNNLAGGNGRFCQSCGKSTRPRQKTRQSRQAHYNAPPPPQNPHYNAAPPPPQNPHYNAAPPPPQNPHHYAAPPPPQNPHHYAAPPSLNPNYNVAYPPQKVFRTNNQHIVIASVVATAIVVAFLVWFFGFRGELRGTFIPSGSGWQHQPTIQFRGNRFTAVSYAQSTAWDQAEVHVETRRGAWTSARILGGAPSWMVRGNHEETEYRGGTALWGVQAPTTWRLTASGTYSISDGLIEFRFSSGGIVVMPFQSTDNTITIDGRLFTRR